MEMVSNSDVESPETCQGDSNLYFLLYMYTVPNYLNFNGGLFSSLVGLTFIYCIIPLVKVK